MLVFGRNYPGFGECCGLCIGDKGGRCLGVDCW